MSERVTVGLMLQQVQVLSHLFYICVCICVYICVCVCVCICVCLCGCICTRISLCICVCICTCICICICLCLCDSSRSAVQTSASLTSTTLHIPTYLPNSWQSSSDNFKGDLKRLFEDVAAHQLPSILLSLAGWCSPPWCWCWHSSYKSIKRIWGGAGLI